MAVAGALLVCASIAIAIVVEIQEEINNELVRKAPQLGDGSLLGSFISTRVYHWLSYNIH